MPHRFILRALILALSVVSFVACVPEDPGEAGGPLDGVDARPGTPAPDGGTAATCEPVATVLPNPKHNAGMACKGCHNGTIAAAPNWKVAGTLFSTAAGGAAIAGATITITDANGVQTKLVTASNGNFYTPANIVFPIRVGASKCPDTKAMQMAAPNGDCNSCHGAGSRIHLP